MPERANSLESAFIACSLAAAALPGLNVTAASAAECLENPDPTTAQAGHWYYHSDRTQHRRCWFFIPAEATGDIPVSSPAPAANTIPDRSGEATQTDSPKPPGTDKTKPREQPQITPPPSITGAADRRDQSQENAGNKKQTSPLNDADREALFRDFVKWQTERSLFGRP